MNMLMIIIITIVSDYSEAYFFECHWEWLSAWIVCVEDPSGL